MTASLRLILGDPVVVAQGPADVTHWGPWQFPSIERLADGRLHVAYHIAADSAKAYGLPVGHAASNDNGKTWYALSEQPANGGLLLPNGDRLRQAALRSMPAEALSLPQPIAVRRGSYGSTYTIFLREDMPQVLQAGWRFSRLPAGKSAWVEETADVDMPGEVRYTAEGVLVFPWTWRIRLAPDGSIWAFLYPWRAPGGRLTEKWHSVFLRSTDFGRSWRMHSEIAYQADRAGDAAWEKRDGFSEPNVAFLPDGALVAFLRTTDGNGIGPMYCAWSADSGQTWSTPQVFDDCGVWPAVVELGCGATLVSYGRPGVFVRVCGEPTGRVWGERLTIVEPGERGKDSCSYTDLLALDDHTAMLVFSNFTHPNSRGEPCKTIMARPVTVADMQGRPDGGTRQQTASLNFRLGAFGGPRPSSSPAKAGR